MIHHVPARQIVELRGLTFRIVPDDWLHRVLRWPFYFESKNYAFRLKIKRIQEADLSDPWPLNPLTHQPMIVGVAIEETLNSSQRHFDVPALEIGQEVTLPWEAVFATRPGHVSLGIIQFPGNKQTDEDARIGIPFTYRVRPEEAMWLATGAVALALFTVVVPIYAAHIGGSPTVINVIPTTAQFVPDATTPSPSLTPDMTTAPIPRAS
jgi:hypothetical protein